MKTKLLMLSAALLFYMMTTVLKAQETIPATGGNASGNGGSVSYSIGQVVYITHTTTTGSVAEGIQQPYEIYNVGINQTSLNIDILVYPNPTSGNLIMQIADFKQDRLVYQLIDSNGRLLETNKVLNNRTDICTGLLPAANYFLHIMIEEKTIQTFKIIKN